MKISSENVRSITWQKHTGGYQDGLSLQKKRIKSRGCGHYTEKIDTPRMRGYVIPSKHGQKGPSMHNISVGFPDRFLDNSTGMFPTRSAWKHDTKK
jgi:hypothetical protein